MTKSLEALIADMKAAAMKATQGEWWSDVVECDGVYGTDDNCGEGFQSYAVYDSNNQTLLDMTNSTAACIHEEYDDDYRMAWDETGRCNAEFIILARPENVLALIEALEQAQQESKVQLETIANLTEIWNDGRLRVAELESLCVNPDTTMRGVEPLCVKLPSLKQSDSGERYQWSDGVFNYRNDVIAAIRAAGGTVGGE